MKDLRRNKFLIVNIISFLRIPAAFISLILIFSNQNVYALVVCIIGVFITDMIDGKIARKWNVVSDFGKTFDPIADKLSLYPLFIGIVIKNIKMIESVDINKTFLKLGEISFLLLLIMEITLAWLSFLLIKREGREGFKKYVGSNFWGKSKTIMESAALSFLFILLFFPSSQLLVRLIVLSLMMAVIFIILSIRKYFLDYKGEKDKIYLWIKTKVMRGD